MTLNIKLQTSRCLLLGLLIIYSASLLSLYVLALTWVWQLVLALLLSAYAYYEYYQRYHPSSSCCISELHYQQQWCIKVRGRLINVELQQATVWQGLMALHLRDTKNRVNYSLLLFPDSCDAQSWRQLKVMLRYGLPQQGLR